MDQFVSFSEEKEKFIKRKDELDKAHEVLTFRSCLDLTVFYAYVDYIFLSLKAIVLHFLACCRKKSGAILF